jgi:hypothetical protein
MPPWGRLSGPIAWDYYAIKMWDCGTVNNQNYTMTMLILNGVSAEEFDTQHSIVIPLRVK